MLALREFTKSIADIRRQMRKKDPPVELGYVDIQILLRDMYEQRYGLLDKEAFEGGSKPNMFASASTHHCEALWFDESMYKDSLRRFLDNKIFEQLGVSYDKFIRRPKWYNDMTHEICAEKLADAPKAAEAAKASIAREIDKISGNKPRRITKKDRHP